MSQLEYTCEVPEFFSPYLSHSEIAACLFHEIRLLSKATALPSSVRSAHSSSNHSNSTCRPMFRACDHSTRFLCRLHLYLSCSSLFRVRRSALFSFAETSPPVGKFLEWSFLRCSRSIGDEPELSFPFTAYLVSSDWGMVALTRSSSC